MLVTGKVALPDPLKVPYGVSTISTIRLSPAGNFGNMVQLFGPLVALQVPFLAPKTRMFRPSPIWPTAPPVWVATQAHGWAVAHRALGVAGHTVPVLIL